MRERNERRVREQGERERGRGRAVPRVASASTMSLTAESRMERARWYCSMLKLL